MGVFVRNDTFMEVFSYILLLEIFLNFAKVTREPCWPEIITYLLRFALHVASCLKMVKSRD